MLVTKGVTGLINAKTGLTIYTNLPGAHAVPSNETLARVHFSLTPWRKSRADMRLNTNELSLAGLRYRGYATW